MTMPIFNVLVYVNIEVDADNENDACEKALSEVIDNIDNYKDDFEADEPNETE